MLYCNSKSDQNLITSKDEIFCKNEPVIYKLNPVYTHCKTIRKNMKDMLKENFEKK